MQNRFNNVIQLFEHVVQKHYHKVAIKDAYHALTYHELCFHAKVVALKLKNMGVKTHDKVVCITKKDVKSIVCFWGIVLSGGIPVLLDEEDGLSSNQQKIDTVQAVIIIRDKTQSVLPIKEKQDVDFNDVIDLENTNGSLPKVGSELSDVFYILLTSGTSGVPKAVQVSHQNVLHYTFAFFEKIKEPSLVNSAHVTTFAADLGMTNLLMSLVSGGTLRVLNKEEATDPAVFYRILKNDHINFLKMTPSHLVSLIGNMDIRSCGKIKNLVLGGEKLTWHTVKLIRSLSFCSNLYNHYGPTETTIGTTTFLVEHEVNHFLETASVPIGKPLGGNFCFLVHKKDGIGELHVAGPGVTLGYFQNESENRKRFIEIEHDGQKTLCYKTGDLCRELEDGNFEFLYRTDRQVKIRGFRIELGEIEQALIRNPDVESATVRVSGTDSKTVIDAFVRRKDKVNLTAAALKTWMKNVLPRYKIPANFYIYDEPVYNANGKLDISTLTKIFRSEKPLKPTVSTQYAGASWATDVEYAWKKILNIDGLSRDDNFFDIGGDSLMAIQVIGRLQRYGYQVNIADLNKRPAFHEFLSLNPGKVHNFSGHKEIAEDGLTISQRLFMSSPDYNIPYCQTILLESEQRINLRALATAINCVIKGHAQLTRSFKQGNSFEHQRTSKLEVGITVIDDLESVAGRIQNVTADLLKSISIGKGHLFVTHVFIHPTGEDYILLLCHHLAVDVISWNIILDELIDYYDQLMEGKIPAINIENTVSEFYRHDTDLYFDSQEILQKPSIFKLLDDDSLQRGHHLPLQVSGFKIPKLLSETLKQLDDDRNLDNISSYLISAFAGAIFDEFQIFETSIDIEFHGRPQIEKLPDLSRSVAWWATTFPIDLIKNDNTPSFCSALLDKAATNANAVNLLKKLNLNKDSKTKPDFRFNYLGHFPEKIGNNSIMLKPSAFNPGPNRGKEAQKEYKIFFTSRFLGEDLIVDIQYQPEMFKGAGIDKFITKFQSLLSASLLNESDIKNATFFPTFKSQIPSIGQPLFTINNAVSLTGKRNVLLTGATGFLGIHILKELLEFEQVDVFCIVRGNNTDQAKNRLIERFKYYFNELPDRYLEHVFVLKGNLTEDDFGLLKANYDNLVEETGIIIHAAADINLMKDYNDLLTINITATSNLLAFAGKCKHPEFHYISSLAVSGFLPNGDVKIFSETDFDYGQLFISPYEQTKFEAEKLVRNYFNAGGRGKIYRSGHIAADSLRAKFQPNIGQNRVFQILKGIMLLKMVPKEYNETISFSYVDVVSKGIVGVCLKSIPSEQMCLHLENPYDFTIPSLVQMLNNTGYDIKTVDTDTFNAAVAEYAGQKSDIEAIELASIWINRFFSYPRHVQYVQHITLDNIAMSGLYFPLTDYNWFAKMIKAGIENEFFAEPHPKEALFLATVK